MKISLALQRTKSNFRLRRKFQIYQIWNIWTRKLRWPMKIIPNMQTITVMRSSISLIRRMGTTYGEMELRCSGLIVITGRNSWKRKMAFVSSHSSVEWTFLDHSNRFHNSKSLWKWWEKFQNSTWHGPCCLCRSPPWLPTWHLQASRTSQMCMGQDFHRTSST